ncbi:MAG: hypothetical protein Q7V19_10135 [Bacteroidales bacterium]|nr:hypothetical protein [Bacteroidales bacterium]
MEYVILWLIFGVVSSIIASAKGYDGCGYFILGVLLGPIGILIAIFNPNKKLYQVKKTTVKKCKFCSFDDNTDAPFCPACGLDKNGFNTDHYKSIAFEKSQKAVLQSKKEEELQSRAGESIQGFIQKQPFTLAIIVSVIVLLAVLFSVSRSCKPTSEHEDQNGRTEENYEWLSSEFSSKPIKEQFIKLYHDLLLFKDDQEFQKAGFDKSPYKNWLVEVSRIEKSKNNNFLQLRGVEISDLRNLALQFTSNNGKINSIAIEIISNFEKVISDDFPITDTAVINQIKSKSETSAAEEARKPIIKSNSHSFKNCSATFDVNGKITKANDVTFMINNHKNGTYSVLFYRESSTNFNFTYKFDRSSGRLYYYSCTDCGYNEESVLKTSVKLSEIASGKGAVIYIAVNKPYSEMNVTIIAF